MTLQVNSEPQALAVERTAVSRAERHSAYEAPIASLEFRELLPWL